MTIRITRIGGVLLPMLLVPTLAAAHHGLDFMLVQTAHLPEQGTAYALTRAALINENHDEVELEPSVLYGALDWLSLELHAHYAKHEGESGEFESIAPAAHIRFTPRGQAFAAGMAVEYESGRADHSDAWELAGVVSYETTTWIATGNLLYANAEGESGEWALATGLRYNLQPRHAFGVEVTHSLESDGSSELALGYYARPTDTFSINVSVGAGIEDGPDSAIRSAFIWQFR